MEVRHAMNSLSQGQVEPLLHFWNRSRRRRLGGPLRGGGGGGLCQMVGIGTAADDAGRRRRLQRAAGITRPVDGRARK